jgi:hypothetical protein
MTPGTLDANISDNWDLTPILGIEESLVSSLLLKPGFRFYAH